MIKIYLIKLPIIISFGQLKNRFKNDNPKRSSRNNNDRSDKIDLKHKTFKENLF